MELAGLLPVVGGLKYVDEVGTVLKHGDEAAAIVQNSDEVADVIDGVGKTWSSAIKGTQDVISGTNIPKSFVMEGVTVNGKEVWVHGNATKHMGEYVNAAMVQFLQKMN